MKRERELETPGWREVVYFEWPVAPAGAMVRFQAGLLLNTMSESMAT